MALSIHMAEIPLEFKHSPVYFVSFSATKDTFRRKTAFQAVFLRLSSVFPGLMIAVFGWFKGQKDGESMSEDVSVKTVGDLSG